MTHHRKHPKCNKISECSWFDQIHWFLIYNTSAQYQFVILWQILQMGLTNINWSFWPILDIWTILDQIFWMMWTQQEIFCAMWPSGKNKITQKFNFCLLKGLNCFLNVLMVNMKAPCVDLWIVSFVNPWFRLKLKSSFPIGSPIRGPFPVGQVTPLEI